MENGHYGNVLVKMNGSSEWQGVCDDGWNTPTTGGGNWGTQNAEVICRMLDFPGAINFTTSSGYGVYNNSADFALDNILCQGDEVSLEDCSYTTRDDCNRNEYVGVACNNTGRQACNPHAISER